MGLQTCCLALSLSLSWSSAGAVPLPQLPLQPLQLPHRLLGQTRSTVELSLCRCLHNPDNGSGGEIESDDLDDDNVTPSVSLYLGTCLLALPPRLLLRSQISVPMFNAAYINP